MPDISMCLNESCELKEQCYRYKVAPKERNQSYQHYAPVKTESGDIVCNDFMDYLERMK